MANTALLIAVIYALIHLAFGLSQLYQRKLPRRNTMVFITGCFSIILSANFIDQRIVMILFILLGFIMIQSGIYLNANFNQRTISPLGQLLPLLLLILILSGIAFSRPL
ncbi:hypothetical protein [Paenibacillus sp. MMS20-IR301]|uniref:hypothetical protein n=1 Tax=Paenibacillus sp. MMS20-IR301 TaxID=2895946 RepID=UPI0028E774D7|nr:hypothetical protein [Paenibacillus sp. MMS20-IR301]WNS42249.1 hypothetical protein LOS79_25195 [Paenibacillus sp. MMS20-IR301]